MSRKTDWRCRNSKGCRGKGRKIETPERGRELRTVAILQITIIRRKIETPERGREPPFADVTTPETGRKIETPERGRERGCTKTRIRFDICRKIETPERGRELYLLMFFAPSCELNVER